MLLKEKREQIIPWVYKCKNESYHGKMIKAFLSLNEQANLKHTFYYVTVKDSVCKIEYVSTAYSVPAIDSKCFSGLGCA